MATISLASDIKQAIKKLDSIQRKQVPYATALALNDVAFEARKAEQNAQRQYLDKPARFTTMGYQVKKADKRKLTAVIFVPQNRWNYLRYVVEGGLSTRTGVKHSVAIDHSLLNKFGSLPRNKVKSLARKKGHFFGSSKGSNYLFKRDSKGRYPIKPLVVFKETTKHTKRYPIWKAATRVVGSRFKHRFDRRMAYALRTAR